MMSEKPWSKSSWKEFTAEQQPKWLDLDYHSSVLDEISRLPPLVFAGEIRSLKAKLAEAAQGRAFVLQAGDCAEEFSRCNAPYIRELLKVILQMSTILTYAGEKPVVKLGRLAGQYGKPRSKDFEMIDGKQLPSYRGDAVNSIYPNEDTRQPDSGRLLQAYHHSTATLNLIRAFTVGGYGHLERVHAWNLEFVKNSPQGQRYEQLARQIDQSLTFLKNIGLDPNMSQLRQVDFYTSHEALLLGYEEALARQDSMTGAWYACSAHMVWIGNRTRQLDGSHVEFLRGVDNPVGIKLDANVDCDEILAILDRLNPTNEWGRIMLISRMGVDRIERFLPPLIRAVTCPLVLRSDARQHLRLQQH